MIINGYFIVIIYDIQIIFEIIRYIFYKIYVTEREREREREREKVRN